MPFKRLRFAQAGERKVVVFLTEHGNGGSLREMAKEEKWFFAVHWLVT